MIDDTLSFLPYISSDRAMHGRGRKSGDKIADLLFFDDGLILGDEKAGTIVTVEFKKPGRDDYTFGNKKADPVLQVIETMMRAVAAGGISRTDGSHVSFAHAARRYAYIIADLTPTLRNVLELYDFKSDWDPGLHVKYQGNQGIAIYAFGYEKLIETAKKRNQAFFSVLLDE